MPHRVAIQHRSVPTSRFSLSLSSALVVLLMVSVVLALLPVTKGNAVRAAGSSFVFTAAGDYAQTLATTANLQAIAHSGAKFHLALGDFSYSATLSAAQWSNYAKSLLPTNFPFEIIPGDHDRGQLSTDATALPDHLGSTGTYGQQYTFDYPRQAPLVRFIMISPGQTPYNGTTCTSLTTVSYNASCVVNATPAMTKGAGSVIAISGTAGAPMIRISTIDPARGYFRSWEAASSNQTQGISRFTVSTSRLTMNFVGTSGGTFTDRFTIAGQELARGSRALFEPCVAAPSAWSTASSPEAGSWLTFHVEGITVCEAEEKKIVQNLAARAMGQAVIVMVPVALLEMR